MGARNSKLLLSQTHQLENRQQRDRTISSFLRSWPGLFRTYRIQTQDKERGKSIYFVTCFQLKQSCPLKLLQNRTAEEFIKHLNWFLTTKGHPRKIYSYNGQAFVAAVK